MGHQPPTIVVVDDASEVRLLLKTRIRLSGRLQVVGEGADGADAVALAGQHRPELMLLDVSMPGMDGLAALPHVLEASPTTKVVLFSGFEEQGLVERAEQLGAAGFVEKSASVDDLVDRLLAVLPASAAPAAHASEDHRSTAAAVDRNVLDEHLERFREVFDSAAIGMATMTLAGTLVRANGALAGLLNRSREDLVGASYGSLTDPEGGHAVSAALEEIRAEPVDVVRFEHGVPHSPDGRRVRATLAPVRDSAGRPLYVFLQVEDVTAQRAAQEGLRRSEERFRLLVEAVEDYAIFMLDPEGHIVSWNSGAQRSKGYAAEEIIGLHFRVFYPPEQQLARHPEHELEVALREGRYEEEGWRIRKDGSRFWANVLITAVFGADGDLVGFAKVTRDTTRRRRLEQEREQAAEALAAANAELETLNRRLQQAAEDQAQFLAVTAHELRTPIGVLAGSAQTLSAHSLELTDEERTEILDAMSMSTGRLRRLLTDLLTASRLQASALEIGREPVLVREAVADGIATLRSTLPDADLRVEVPPDLTVLADRDRLAQALENLLSNALRHGVPPVRVTAEEVGSHVEIRVSDQGPGVAAEVRPRLFERFATGMTRGGTGLGLFIVRELSRAQGGDAFYESGSPDSPAGAFVVRLAAASAASSNR